MNKKRALIVFLIVILSLTMMSFEVGGRARNWTNVPTQSQQSNHSESVPKYLTPTPSVVLEEPGCMFVEGYTTIDEYCLSMRTGPK